MSGSAPVRIKVLLHNFYDDHRQKAIVTIDRSWTIVKQLQSHIKSMVHAKKIYLTTLDGFWFPSNEDISILLQSDTVVAHSLTSAKKSSNLSIDSANSSLFITNVNKSPADDNISVAVAASSTSSNRKRKVGRCNDAPQISVDDPEALRSDEKKKRKRVRKRKQKSKELAAKSPPEKHSKWISDLNQLDVSDAVKTNSNRNKFKKIPQEIVPRAMESKKHIRFSGNENSDDDDNEKPYECDMQTSKANDVDDEPFVLPTEARVIVATYTETALNTEIRVDEQHETVTMQKTVVKQPLSDGMAVTNPIIKDKSPPKETSPETKAIHTGTKETDAGQKETAMEVMRQNIDTMSLPPLKGSPNVNDIIAFKRLKLTETYEPTMSEYIIGMVQKVDAELVTLFIMAGGDQLKEPDGKFQISDDEATDAETEVELRQCELLEPKICQLTSDK